MRAETRVLRVLLPENGGPRRRSVLDALAKRYGEGRHLIDYLIAGGRLKRYGKGRGTRWGLPGRTVAPATPKSRKRILATSKRAAASLERLART